MNSSTPSSPVPPVSPRGRGVFRAAALVLLAALATACGTTPSQGPATGAGPRPAETSRDPFKIAAVSPLTPQAMAGRSVVRVALLAPFSSTNPALREEAQTMQAAAELALFEHGDGTLLLMPKDSGGTPEEAARAARGALQDGADYILGPMFASGVAAVAPYARANGAPVISFSTDTSEAGRGIYVLTYLPEDETRRIVSYAASQGVKRLVVIAPLGRYGDRVEEAARETAGANGMSFAGVERYEPSSPSMASATEAARRAAALTQGAARGEVAVLIPERGALVRAIAQTLTQAGAPGSRVRYLGTGLWNDPATLSDARLAGGWFVTPDVQARANFETRFRSAYGRRPTRLAGMGYDATALIARMTLNGDRDAVNRRAIETPDGFVGVDGLFRFNRGVVERAMAINEASPRGARVVQAAPQTFAR